MNVDGSDIVNLSNHSSFDGWPAWSPDGTRIIFCSDRLKKGVWHIYMMSLISDPDGSGIVGSDVVRLTPSDYGDVSFTQPAWSSDGSKIVCTIEWDEERGDLFILYLGKNKL